MSLPAWAARLRPEGLSRTARLAVCQRCTGLLLVGLDAERCAFAARADYTRVNSLGEVLALAQGRETYALTWHGRPELNRRDRWQIRGRPADTCVVVVDHRCGDYLPAAALTPGSPLAPVGAPRKPTPDEPPY